ncbi:hypothetical protein DITRI_Ditri11bG0018900 [Diplodiscus trichospermus]
MAKMLIPALNILLLAIVLMNFASISMPQTTNSEQQLPLSRFQLASSSQVPIIASRNSSTQVPTLSSSSAIAESQQLSSDLDKEKKEEKKEKKEEKKKKKKDCSVATVSVKQSNMGVFCMVISLALFFYI